MAKKTVTPLEAESPEAKRPGHKLRAWAALPTVKAHLGNPSTASIYRMVQDGRLPQPYYLSSDQPRWDLYEIDALLLQRQAAPKAKAAALAGQKGKPKGRQRRDQVQPEGERAA
jgi:predicted DNA-binding transcriptional regulator AlpA